MLLFFPESQFSRDEIPEKETAEIVKEDHDDNKESHFQNLSAIDSNDTAEDNQNTKQNKNQDFSTKKRHVFHPSYDEPKGRGLRETRMTFMTVMAMATKETSTH